VHFIFFLSFARSAPDPVSLYLMIVNYHGAMTYGGSVGAEDPPAAGSGIVFVMAMTVFEESRRACRGIWAQVRRYGIMGAMIRQQQGDVYVLRVTGLLRKSEVDALQASAAKVLDGDPLLCVRLLILLEKFEGWERNPDWGDMSFYIEHGDKITKIAIVGDPKWEAEFKMFTGAGFRPAPVRFFPSDQLQQAHTWLAA
jgi:hypothetical protein